MVLKNMHFLEFYFHAKTLRRKVWNLMLGLCYLLSFEI